MAVLSLEEAGKRVADYLASLGLRVRPLDKSGPAQGYEGVIDSYAVALEIELSGQNHVATVVAKRGKEMLFVDARMIGKRDGVNPDWLDSVLVVWRDVLRDYIDVSRRIDSDVLAALNRFSDICLGEEVSCELKIAENTLEIYYKSGVARGARVYVSYDHRDNTYSVILDWYITHGQLGSMLSLNNIPARALDTERLKYIIERLIATPFEVFYTLGLIE